VAGRIPQLSSENPDLSVLTARTFPWSALSRLLESEPRGGGRQAVIDALQKAGRQVFNGWP